MTAVSFTATAVPRDTAEHEFARDVSTLEGAIVAGSALTVLSSDAGSAVLRGSVPADRASSPAAVADFLEDTLISGYGIYLDVSVVFDPAP